ncbi:hypothetical protein COT70_01160 [candidate division WWE3 bacterium CG09_land_8_20_14_0_10_47_33]|uniref:DNA polymerase III subunit delta n=1 Tax=candidate division WWE3 bacterium CG_4_9_14_0_2_um_filter_48_10 TaxID=1975078 RepID=A0A2M8EIW2_UNCKA|nr:MAG: hypothetical protein COT70_01160 [candidate division WWE3 bacterium CG09_land_8_20_14_0_10_47_33]PJC22603.1 MAG: hypothetical protein CO059_02185 [candidate division WWE3 bacterium CG_4_9_14_0_2_um_filter_48_10]PJE52365.1 MAG: hypothetical protein COV28_00025 [candidate division WWE3 bacterium CG10_big_fil_rev_8_21_14_0_10_48_23]
MSSVLLCGGDCQKRKEIASQILADQGIRLDYDIINVGEEAKKIGINEIKTLLPHLHIRGKNEKKAFLIFEAQRLTPTAQNALLKLLEEPPTHLTIILSVPNPRLLLPTIVSRCLITEVKADKRGRVGGDVIKLLEAQGGQRLMLFEEKVGYNQQSIYSFLDAVEAHLKEELNQKSAQMLLKLWRAKELLRDASANSKLIIDELLLSW